MRILTRHVLLELAKWFLAWLAILTVFMLLLGVGKEAIDRHLPPVHILRLIPYVLPDALRFAVPATLLLATTIVFGRMSGSNEVVALKSLGISPRVILVPALVMAGLLSLVTVYLNDLAVSWGRKGIQQVASNATVIEEIAYSMLTAQGRFSVAEYAIIVRKVEDRRLIHPTFSRLARGSTPAITVEAEEAELRADPIQNTLKIILRNGTAELEGQGTLRFPDTYEQEIPLPDARQPKDHQLILPSTLALRVIPDQIVEQEAAIEQYEHELAARAAYEMLCGDFDELTGMEWETRAAVLAGKWNRLHRLRTEPYRRWAAGFSCLCFVWVGAPMAIWLRNRDFSTIFFRCFGPILVVYYPLLAVGLDSAKNGTLPPYSVWVCNLLLILWGTLLVRKVIRY